MSINIRFRKNSNGFFGAFLDIYSKGQRQYFYPDITVTEDYSKPLKDRQGFCKKDKGGRFLYPKIKPEDREKMETLQRVKLEKEVELVNNRLGFGKAGKKLFIHDFFKRIARDKNNNSHYANLSRRLEEFAGDHFPIQEFNEFKIKEFFSFMRKRGCKEISIQTYYYGLSAGLQMAVREKIIPVNPKVYLSRKDKPRSDETKREFLTFEELKQLTATPFPYKHKQVADAFIFACMSGLRIGDLVSLKHSNIVEGVLHYRQRKSSKEFHYLPLNKQAQEILQRQPLNQSNERIFWNFSKHPSSYNIYFERWAKQAKINKHITWHVARHTHATLLFTYGADVYTVSKILGHSDVRITQRYAKVVTKLKREAVEKIPDLGDSTLLQEAL